MAYTETNTSSTPIGGLWWALMTTGCRELINVNKVPPAQLSGGSLGGKITGADVNICFLGHFLSLNLDFLNVS